MAKRVTEKFRCPHCDAVLVKSPMAVIMGRCAGFIGFSERPLTATCVACGCSIDFEAMVRGDYDIPETSKIGMVFVLGLVAAGTFLLDSHTSLGLGFSFGITMAVLFAGEWGLRKAWTAATRK